MSQNEPACQAGTCNCRTVIQDLELQQQPMVLLQA
jgi:hypothetical protein